MLLLVYRSVQLVRAHGWAYSADTYSVCLVLPSQGGVVRPILGSLGARPLTKAPPGGHLVYMPMHFQAWEPLLIESSGQAPDWLAISEPKAKLWNSLFFHSPYLGSISWPKAGKRALGSEEEFESLTLPLACWLLSQASEYSTIKWGLKLQQVLGEAQNQLLCISGIESLEWVWNQRRVQMRMQILSLPFMCPWANHPHPWTCFINYKMG